MNRYQIYIDPSKVNSLDRLADMLDISRSQVIRDGLERIFYQYETIIAAKKSIRTKTNPILAMKGKGMPLKKSISRNIDDIYLKD